MPNLEIFAIHGVGLETTDLAACRERGIVLTTTPVLFDDVADLAPGPGLAACREIPTADRFVRSGGWEIERLRPGRKMSYRALPDARALAQESDILFLCAAGLPKGVGEPMIDRDVLDALGPRGVFINVARGWLVDEPELVAALRERRLGAAGLDVFDNEPHVRRELCELESLVLTPHTASSTEETPNAMGENVVGNLVSWFSGAGALTPVELG